MDDRPPESSSRLPLFLFFLVMVFFLLLDGLQLGRSFRSMNYSDFLSHVSEGSISEFSIGSRQIVGRWNQTPAGPAVEFRTNRIEDPQLVQRLEQAKVRFTGEAALGFWWGILGWAVLMGVLYGWGALSLRSGGGGDLFRSNPLLSFSRSKAKVYVQTELKTRFEDVAGVDEAKEELKEIVNFLKHPEKYAALGGRMPKGVILLGPPGTGKTLLARAVAGEAQVPFFSINGSEFVELFVGLGAMRVRDLFKEARAHTPCIIFIDELDALGKARGISVISGSGNDEKEQTLNQLLAEMDGFDPAEGVVVLAATNRPEVLDPALLRAGRFDRQVLVDKPDRLGREKILLLHLKGIKVAPTVHLSELAAMTVGFSGADLANLANEAALIATRRQASEVSQPDFTLALERIVAGVERRTRILSPAEKNRVAHHEMGHVAVALALGLGEVVHKVSIIPRGGAALGYTWRREVEDRFVWTRQELEAKMAIALGGRAAEQVFFEGCSTGAGDDLDKATEIARSMVTRFGMGNGLGLAVYERESAGTRYLVQSSTKAFDYSEKTAERIDASVQKLLDQAYQKAQQVILERRRFIEQGVFRLLEEESLDEQELRVLWGQPELRILSNQGTRSSLSYEAKKNQF
jgi:cell division protease FtsH